MADEAGADEPPVLPERPSPDAAEDRERAHDARMVRGVRWRLVLFSGGATLLVLLLLGVAIYTAVGDSLVNTSIGRMGDRANRLSNWVCGPRDRRQPLTDLLLGQDTGTFAYV